MCKCRERREWILDKVRKVWRAVKPNPQEKKK